MNFYIISSIVGFILFSLSCFLNVHLWEYIESYDIMSNRFEGVWKKKQIKVKYIILLLITGLIPIIGIIFGFEFLCSVIYLALFKDNFNLKIGRVNINRNVSRWVYKNVFSWLDKEI